MRNVMQRLQHAADWAEDYAYLGDLNLMHDAATALAAAHACIDDLVKQLEVAKPKQPWSDCGDNT